MICRHSRGDPNCGSSGGSSSVEYVYRDTPCNKKHYPDVETPDSKNYDIVQIERVGEHLVLKVLYPNCSKCAFEGNKVMVFINIGELEVIRWKEIDPHFRPSKEGGTQWAKGTLKDVKKAPSPVARFPATEEGWKDAIVYARTKSSPNTTYRAAI